MFTNSSRYVFYDTVTNTEVFRLGQALDLSESAKPKFLDRATGYVDARGSKRHTGDFFWERNKRQLHTSTFESSFHKVHIHYFFSS